MLTLDAVLDMWDTDSKIDYENLGEESIHTPILHAKYLRLLVQARQLYRREQKRVDRVVQKRTSYYNGELDRTELEKQGWEPFLLARPTKAGMEKLIAADKIVATQMDNVKYYELMMETIESILSSIQRRTWDVKTAVEYRRFTSGVL